jgi:uncharacterized protein
MCDQVLSGRPALEAFPHLFSHRVCKTAVLGSLLISGLVCGTADPAPRADIPRALYQEAPADLAFPATAQGIRIPSEGQQMNAMIQLPGGKGPHPVVVMMHGLPGYDGNLDLAQLMRRAGWAVLSFHYRGAWGSEGTFSFEGAVRDGDAVIDWLKDPESVRTFRTDRDRIVVLGHSMGGYVAASSCAHHPELRGCILLAPWDPSLDARKAAEMTDAARDRFAAEAFEDVEGRVNIGMRQFFNTLLTGGQKWQLADFAPGLVKHAVIIVLATRDDDDDKALALLPALKAQHPTRLIVETFETDHSFDDRRIALGTTLLDWLAELPGAPAGR